MVVFPLLCEQVQAPQWMIPAMNAKVEVAPEVIGMIYDTFDKDLELTAPFFYNEVFHRCDRTHYQDMYHPYWYHPDHLGSSSYITNLDGEINQHLEYLPFGEALVEEHLSSYNSPFKFNAKEMDAETGNYYYGARYYDAKWSIWLSVDPYTNIYPASSPYSYVNNNPINSVDINGRYIIFIGGLRTFKGRTDQIGYLGGYKIHKEDEHEYWSKSKNKFGRTNVDIAGYYQNKYSDDNIGYTSGSSHWNSQASQRMEEGRNKAKLFHKQV